MNISFNSKKLGKMFNSETELTKQFGKENARYIMRRMMVLRAAPSLAQVSFRPPERRHELTGEKKGIFAVDIKNPFRLTFKPDHNPLPLKEDGGIDLEKVTAITILEVEDYH
jgi:proteic killer suppression protein